MCCNGKAPHISQHFSSPPILVAIVEGGCHTTGNPLFYDLSFFDLFRWMLIIISTILAIFALVSRFVNSQKDVSQDTILQEKDTAFETIGELGWLDHRSVFAFFVKAAEKDFSDDKSLLLNLEWTKLHLTLYFLDDKECNFLADQTWQGWLTFCILMITHLGKDLMKERGWFCGGLLLILLTWTAIYASTVYNFAIARSNAELVANAVIVLYLVDVDEQVRSTPVY
ncbi:LOW QUALITY PROTEIN: hypothetical protein ACHAWO_010028 [Cyclotella atomus]|uniref:Uncharacterized protein n=1 Tax=Cyclotella atomus TaxID=382360 RepID=A0ABD3NV19_9STRA